MLMLYKITIFLVVITLIYILFVRGYVSNDILEQYRLAMPDYKPAYITIGSVLVLISVVLIVISLFHFLFM